VVLRDKRLGDPVADDFHAVFGRVDPLAGPAAHLAARLPPLVEEEGELRAHATRPTRRRAA
jgi:hypothetical protein